MIPCFDCRFGARAVEEIVSTYVSIMRGERLPKDDRRLAYLPRALSVKALLAEACVHLAGGRN